MAFDVSLIDIGRVLAVLATTSNSWLQVALVVLFRLSRIVSTAVYWAPTTRVFAGIETMGLVLGEPLREVTPADWA